MYTYKAKLIHIINGDTVDAEIDLGFGVYVKQRIKLYGINTPDSRSNDYQIKQSGIDSKDALSTIIDKKFQVQTIMNKRGKVGRVLGVLHNLDDYGKPILNVNDEMVRQGHAIEYGRD